MVLAALELDNSTVVAAPVNLVLGVEVLMELTLATMALAAEWSPVFWWVSWWWWWCDNWWSWWWCADDEAEADEVRKTVCPVAVYPATVWCWWKSLFSSEVIKMLTKAYSMSDAKTNTVQEDIKMSIALIYETGGSDFCDWACWVLRVKSDVTQSVTRAGTASGLIQKEIHDITTIRQVGT